MPSCKNDSDCSEDASEFRLRVLRSAAAYHQWVGNAKPSAMVRNSLQYLKLIHPSAEKSRKVAQPVWWPPILLALGGAAAAAPSSAPLKNAPGLTPWPRHRKGEIMIRHSLRAGLSTDRSCSA